MIDPFEYSITERTITNEVNYFDFQTCDTDVNIEQDEFTNEIIEDLNEILNACWPLTELSLYDRRHNPSSLKCIQAFVLCLRSNVMNIFNGTTSCSYNKRKERLDIYQKENLSNYL